MDFWRWTYAKEIGFYFSAVKFHLEREKTKENKQNMYEKVQKVTTPTL